MQKLLCRENIEREIFTQTLVELVAKLTYYRRLERLWQLISQTYSDPKLNLDFAAKSVGISKNRLNILTRQTSNFTFYQLLIRYRLLKAITMMSEKNYSISEIALDSGFGTLNTFERNFRSIIGMSPKEYKSKMMFRERELKNLVLNSLS